MFLQNLKKAHYLKRLLRDRLVFSGPTFNEFAVRCPQRPEELNRRLLDRGIIGGLPLGRFFADRVDQMLVCVTEQTTRAEMDAFARAFSSA